MNFGYDEEEEKIIKQVINKILEINSPMLRIVVTEIVCGEVKKAYILEHIKSRKMALAEIKNFFEKYVDEIIKFYELSKCLMIDVLEDMNMNGSGIDKEDEWEDFEISHFPLYRKGSIESKELENIINLYAGLNYIDEAMEKLTEIKAYKSYKEQVEDKMENFDIWKDLLKSKKDSKEYKFFSFLMKSIVEGNARLTEN